MRSRLSLSLSLRVAWYQRHQCRCTLIYQASRAFLFSLFFFPRSFFVPSHIGVALRQPIWSRLCRGRRWGRRLIPVECLRRLSRHLRRFLKTGEMYPRENNETFISFLFTSFHLAAPHRCPISFRDPDQPAPYTGWRESTSRPCSNNNTSSGVSSFRECWEERSGSLVHLFEYLKR